MPATFLGLVLYTAFLLPGYVSYVQRRSKAPTPKLSTLVETVSLLAVSVITNGLALAAFALLRAAIPHHTPDLTRLAAAGTSYTDGRPGYIAAWGSALLTVSCLLAYAFAAVSSSSFGWVQFLARRLNPVIIEVSAWYKQFEAQPPALDGREKYPYVACWLEDGSYVAGRLDWYSTEIEETADRDLALTDPLTVIDHDGDPVAQPADARLIVSARRMKWLTVTWVDEPQPEAA